MMAYAEGYMESDSRAMEKAQELIKRFKGFDEAMNCTEVSGMDSKFVWLTDNDGFQYLVHKKDIEYFKKQVKCRP